MTWTVEASNELRDWYRDLTDAQQDAVEAAVSMLEERGPALGRPLADSITASAIHNMKELRPLGGHLRILFVFDPRRSAVLLVGGDKTGRWQEWYREAIPMAERMYETYLQETDQ